MPIIVQVCVVIATIAIVIVTIMVVRLMRRLEVLSAAATQSLARVDAFLEQSQKASIRIEGMLGSLEHMTGSVRGAVDSLEVVVQRAAGLASSILDEAERPVQNVVAVIRAVQAGAAFLVQQWTSRTRPSGNAPPAHPDIVNAPESDPAGGVASGPNAEYRVV